jgi:azurin
MIQHGLLPLVFVVFILGVMGFFSPAQTGGQNASKAGIDAITVCSSGVDFDTDLAMVKAARIVVRNSSKPMVSEQDDVTTIWLEVVPELMKYDQDTITVKAGKKIILELDNLDGMQHNLLILKPNSLEKVGAAADAMLRDPRASEKHYVPEIPEVLFSTNMLGPNEVYTLKFTAPSIPDNYPFVCTFPGHWRMMNGILVVEKP